MAHFKSGIKVKERERLRKWYIESGGDPKVFDEICREEEEEETLEDVKHIMSQPPHYRGKPG